MANGSTVSKPAEPIFAQMVAIQPLAVDIRCVETANDRVRGTNASQCWRRLFNVCSRMARSRANRPCRSRFARTLRSVRGMSWI